MIAKLPFVALLVLVPASVTAQAQTRVAPPYKPAANAGEAIQRIEDLANTGVGERTRRRQDNRADVRTDAAQVL